MPQPTEQTIADQVNLGPHEKELIAEDETGTPQRFIVHRPTMRDQLKIGVATAALTATPSAVPVGDIILQLAEAVATLNTVIDKRPATLPANVEEWTDMTLVGNLFTAFGEWLNNFLGNLLPDGGADRRPTGTT